MGGGEGREERVRGWEEREERGERGERMGELRKKRIRGR